MSDSLGKKFIEIQNVEQTFKTAKGSFPALRDINPDEMTPKQAMEALYGLRALLKP